MKIDDEDEDEEDEEKSGQPLRPPSALPGGQRAGGACRSAFRRNDPAAQHPAAARLTTSATLANVKLAAALTDDDVDELGMTIAYLKRALKAVTNALDATAQCEQEKLSITRVSTICARGSFRCATALSLLMGHYRNEWRRRYGQGH